MTVSRRALLSALPAIAGLSALPASRALAAAQSADRSARGSRRVPGGLDHALPELGLHHADADAGDGRGPRVRRCEGHGAHLARRHAAKDRRGARAVRRAHQRLAGRDWLSLRHQRRREHRRALDGLHPRRQRGDRRAALRDGVRALFRDGQDDRRGTAHCARRAVARSRRRTWSRWSTAARSSSRWPGCRTRTASVTTCVPLPTWRTPTARSSTPTASRARACFPSTSRRPAWTRCASAPTSGCLAPTAWPRSTCVASCSIG